MHIPAIHDADVAAGDGGGASLRADHWPAEEKHGLLFVLLQLVASCGNVANDVWCYRQRGLLGGATAVVQATNLRLACHVTEQETG